MELTKAKHQLIDIINSTIFKYYKLKRDINECKNSEQLSNILLKFSNEEIKNSIVTKLLKKGD